MNTRIAGALGADGGNIDAGGGLGTGQTKKPTSGPESRSPELLDERIIALLPCTRKLIGMLLSDEQHDIDNAISRLMRSGAVAERPSSIDRRMVLVSRPRKLGLARDESTAAVRMRAPTRWGRQEITQAQQRERRRDRRAAA